MMIELNEIQKDALQEIGNIGLGNAVTALSDLVGESFLISTPIVERLEIVATPSLFGDPEQLSVGVAALVTGAWEGQTAFLFSWDSACALWRALLGQSPNDLLDLQDIHQSVTSEIANIMLGNYLRALSDLTDLCFHLSPPAFVADMSGAILSTLAAEAYLWDRELLTIQTTFDSPSLQFAGYFLYWPELGGLERLFAKLGVS